MEGRLRYLPISLALGLFVGDVLTLLLAGGLTLPRVLVSAAISVAVWITSRWALARRG